MQKMENCYSLSDSCENYILKKHSLIVAAFPSVIIFGNIENTQFKQSQCFKFHSFEIKILLKVIGEIIVFFNGETLDDQLTKKNFSVELNNFIDYYWQGNLIGNKKSVVFSIESKGSKTFSISLNLEDLNNLIFLIKRCLLASLCLKDIQEQFILFVIDFSENEILACKKNYSLGSNIVQRFLNELETKDNTKMAPFIQILTYYNEIVLVLKDFNMLHYSEND